MQWVAMGAAEIQFGLQYTRRGVMRDRWVGDNLEKMQAVGKLALGAMEWRLQDCFRQQRLPQLTFGSDVAIALTMFLAHNANGGELVAPAIKR